MTTDPKPLELKPCAHCGAIPNRFKERSEFWRIVCDSCGIRTEAVYPVTVAEKAWNRRHVDREMVEKIYLMTKGHIVGWYGDETIEQIIEALEKEK